MKIRIKLLGLLLISSSGWACAQGFKGSVPDVVMRQNGLPLIVYRGSGGTNALRFLDCHNTDCSVATRSAEIDGVAIGITSRPRVGLRLDGRPLIAYQAAGNEGLKVFDCADADCSVGTVRALAPTMGNFSIRGIGIAIRPTGEPLIVYGDADSSVRRMKVYDCDDVNCATGTARIPAGQTAFTEDDTAITMRSSGLALLSSKADNLMQVYDCADSGCTTGSMTFYERPSFTESEIRADDTAFIAYQSGTTGALNALSCNDGGCTTASISATGSGLLAGFGVSLAMRPLDLPIITFVQNMSGQAVALKVYDCDNRACSSGVERVIDGVSVSVQDPSMALRTDDTPLVVYEEQPPGENFQRLLVARCDDSNCTTNSFGPIVPDGLFSDGFE